MFSLKKVNEVIQIWMICAIQIWMVLLYNPNLDDQWRIQGGVRGVQMHPPFEGLPSRALSKCAQT